MTIIQAAHLALTFLLSNWFALEFYRRRKTQELLRDTQKLNREVMELNQKLSDLCGQLTDALNRSTNDIDRLVGQLGAKR